MTFHKTETLLPANYYHIYNRAVGDEKLFRTKKDYFYFQEKLKRYINPLVDIYSYCLLPNHFHLLVRTKETATPSSKNEGSNLLITEEKFRLAFKNLFISYSKSFNKVHKRMGRLFMQPYKRILVEDESYLLGLICYIHRNPIHHGYVEDYKQWEYSSFNNFFDDTQPFIAKNEVLRYFGGLENFLISHEENKTYKGTKELIFD